MLNNQTQVTGNDFDESLLVQNSKNSWFSKIGMMPISLAATVSMFVAAGFYISYSNNLDEIRQKETYFAELSQLSEKIEKNSLLVLMAETDSFKGLSDSQIRVENILKVLDKGGKLGSNTANIKALSGKSKQDFDKIVLDWSQNKALIETLLKKQEQLPLLKEKINEANKNAEQLFFAATNLQQSLNKESNGVNPILVQEVSLLTQRIISEMKQVFSGSGLSLQEGYASVKNLRSLEKVINDLENGSYVFNSSKVYGESLKNLQDLKQSFIPFKEVTNDLLAQITSLNDAKEVANIMSIASKNIAKTSGELSLNISKEMSSIEVLKYISILMLIVSLLLISLNFLKLHQRSNDLARLAKVLQRNQNNEESVEDLLEKMEPLAKGDLSREIFVEDKFLSSVAEGIDIARINLSTIMVEMKTASEKVLAVAQNNKEVTNVLNIDTYSQIEKLSEAIEEVGKITNDIDEIAQATYGVKENSLMSKESSEHGSKLVFSTIKHMDQIRLNIQESSKKIKKLGESAQTITNVIDLIREITKKINILSLNAAIQAASSKSSTREFTILAQEVQDLAKDSEDATSKIEALVIEIQSDTAEAIAAMERTTQEIVEGSRMSQEAGRALEEIGRLAVDVAQQVEEASIKLEEKSAEMAMVSLSMDELRKISEKTTDSTQVYNERAEDLQSIANNISKIVGKYKT